MKLFSPDSKFMQAMSRVADLVIINVLYILCCIPIITIGAATTALYTACSKMAYEKDGGLYRAFFRSFKENFGQSTILWLIYILAGGIIGVDIYFFSCMQKPLSYIGIVFCTSMILLLMVVSYTFPLLCHFENPKMTTVKNAIMMSIGYLPRSVVMLLINALPWILLFSNTMLFFQTGFIWFFFYFSFAAYINSLLLKKVFRPYLGDGDDIDPEDEE